VIHKGKVSTSANAVNIHAARNLPSTASGKVKANVAHKRHRLISKPKKMKRKARGTFTLEKGDANLVLTYMPYMRG